MDFRHTRPPPPQPPPPSDPHQPPPQQQVPPPPGAWYSGQFPYHSPSPPPPQWATPQAPPPHSDHHLHPPPPPYAAASAPPPPMPYSSNHYSLPPRPHMPPPPHPHYPPVNQEWNNSSWGHQGWDHSAQNKNEDDWAARARAWAASKAVTDDQHHNSQIASTNRPEETNYQGQYQQNLDPNYQEFQQHSVPQSNYQQYPSSFEPPPRPPANHLQESGHFSHTVRDGSLSVHQQEVPSSYSSVAEPRDINGTFYQQSHMPFASAPHHQIQSGISPNNRPVTVEQYHYSLNNLSSESASDLSNQPLDFGPRYGHDHGPFGQSAPPGMPYSSMPPIHPTGPQVDPSMGTPSPVSMHSGPLFGRVTGSSFPPAMQSANTVFPVLNVFPGDAYGNPGFPERPKKASVPNWLREEIIKKKTVIGNSALELSRNGTESNEDEFDQPLGRVDQLDGKDMESPRSTEEEEDDDEDYAEAAKTAAINQEIKSILTEVLLKVTDELFDEIATKVLEEDDLTVEVEHKAEMTSAAVITPKSSAKILIPPKTKVTDLDDANGKPNSSSPGDVLGLGSYASDDDDEEEEVQNSVIPSSNRSPPPVHLAENGCSGSKVDHSRAASPPRDAGNHKDSSPEEVKVKVKPDSSDTSKSKPSETESVKTENLLPGDREHSKVDENSRAHDDRSVKRAKKEDQNGTKEKIKDRDSEKKVNIKDDRKERDRDRKYNDKEESRKREKERDDKNERSKYKAVNDSGRPKRHHSPPPGGRGRSSKDSSSDDSGRRVHSNRSDLSPSPVRSRRQVSRSPPSKRSHHRHSNYSSLETTRERRRSRSRSRSRRG